MALIGRDERHIRRQLHLAKESYGPTGQQIGDVNVQSQDGDEVGKAHSRVHRTEGHERFAVTRVTFASCLGAGGLKRKQKVMMIIILSKKPRYSVPAFSIIPPIEYKNLVLRSVFKVIHILAIEKTL